VNRAVLIGFVLAITMIVAPVAWINVIAWLGELVAGTAH
jgi:hypothetical protein